MKRSISALLLVAMLLTGIPMAEAADEQGNSISVIYFEDGSYFVVSMVEDRLAADSLVVRASNKSGSKTYTYYENTGVAAWAVTLTASFSYDGNSATCTAANCSVSIYDSAWYVISKNTYRSGNTATANVTMGKRVLGVTTKTVPCTITLSCDANGNLS